MSKEIVLHQSTVLARIKTAATPEERAVLQAEAMTLVEDDRFPRPLPRFLIELPYGGDSDEITDRIASAILVSEDPDAAQAEGGSMAGKDMIGKKATVHDLVVLPTNPEKVKGKGGWPCYLLLDVSLDDDPARYVVNTGAKQAVTRLARAWADNQLPVSGVFTEIPGTNAVTFMVEPPL
jgi:hypothetical protein